MKAKIVMEVQAGSDMQRELFNEYMKVIVEGILTRRRDGHRNNKLDILYDFNYDETPSSNKKSTKPKHKNKSTSTTVHK